MDDLIRANDPPELILLVDDDPTNLDILSRLLQPRYEVVAAPSGERALAIVTREKKPDLILLDVVMPGMNGYAVLAQLREDPASQTIPVIFVTGMDSSEDEERGLELGAVDYIAKPYRPAIILARVRAQLELKRTRDWLRNQNAYLEAEVARRMRDILLTQDITMRNVDRSIDFLDMAQQIANFHHEKWDGSGYPEGRCGDDIPLPARLMALADVFDALISSRVYKAPLPAAEAREIIAAERGRRAATGRPISSATMANLTCCASACCRS